MQVPHKKSGYPCSASTRNENTSSESDANLLILALARLLKKAQPNAFGVFAPAWLILWFTMKDSKRPKTADQDGLQDRPPGLHHIATHRGLEVSENGLKSVISAPSCIRAKRASALPPRLHTSCESMAHRNGLYPSSARIIDSQGIKIWASTHTQLAVHWCYAMTLESFNMVIKALGLVMCIQTARQLPLSQSVGITGSSTCQLRELGLCFVIPWDLPRKSTKSRRLRQMPLASWHLLG